MGKRNGIIGEADNKIELLYHKLLIGTAFLKKKVIVL